MKAYKVFNSDWKCKEFQYEVGKTYKLLEYGKLIEPILCNKGFHACKNISNCFSYYNFDPKNKIAEVELSGTILGLEDDKQCSNIITIVKELSWEEMLKLANSGHWNSGHSNSGHSNSGNRNSGDSNSGHRNSGDSNSGHSNSGHSNSGNMNSGDSNSGHRNSGDWNSGDRNSGDSNSGHWNSGDSNSGHSNSGNMNSGDSNSGHWDSGHSNSGHSNSGHSNSGNRNSGDSNSGDSNSGDRNSGDWNSGDSNSGFFNSNTPKEILIFNKYCNRNIWDSCNKPSFIYNIILNKWISESYMTEQEKIDNPKFHVTQGYLKTYSYKEAWENAYNSASKEDIELLKSLPNFDAKVFEEITGIKVD